ncbi:TPA: GntP family permease [Neisseria gonorrhoeae]
MDGRTQTLSAQTLLGISAAAIILILILIVKFRIRALLTLVIASLLTALATGLPTGSIVNDVLVKNFGGTLGGVALLVGLGAMLGRLVETSGGAQSLADALIRMFGEKRAPFAPGVASLIFGFPIFFDAGLIVMLPIVIRHRTAHETGRTALRACLRRRIYPSCTSSCRPIRARLPLPNFTARTSARF